MDCKKKYENALTYIRDLIEHNVISIESAEKYFPELKENKDERIRKAIISGMTTIKNQGKETFAAIRINDCIAWLEKQGESNLIEEIKRKKDLLLNEKRKAISSKEKLSLGGRIAMLEELLVWLKYGITGIKSKHAEGKLGEMIKNLKSANEVLEQKPTCDKKDETSIAVNNPDAYKIGFADGEAHAKEEQWKPSDEQIKHLTHVVYDAKHKNDISTYGYEPYFHLSNLLMQIKKLKG